MLSLQAQILLKLCISIWRNNESIVHFNKTIGMLKQICEIQVNQNVVILCSDMTWPRRKYHSSLTVTKNTEKKTKLLLMVEDYFHQCIEVTKYMLHQDSSSMEIKEQLLQAFHLYFWSILNLARATRGTNTIHKDNFKKKKLC